MKLSRFFNSGSPCDKGEETVTDKNEPFRVFMHYTDPDACREVTVFGEERPGLFYNYSDRLYGDLWSEGCKLADTQAKPKTARYFEIVLNHLHGATDVNLQHVSLGCNRSSGYSYLIFGYTYTQPPAAPEPEQETYE